MALYYADYAHTKTCKIHALWYLLTSCKHYNQLNTLLPFNRLGFLREMSWFDHEPALNTRWWSSPSLSWALHCSCKQTGKMLPCCVTKCRSHWRSVCTWTNITDSGLKINTIVSRIEIFVSQVSWLYDPRFLRLILSWPISKHTKNVFCANVKVGTDSF